MQSAGRIRHTPIALAADVRAERAEALNQVLADTLMHYHLYKRAHSHVAGRTFYQLHLLFDAIATASCTARAVRFRRRATYLYRCS